MADNTVTLVLNGDVPLAEFAKAIVNFNELVKALSEESGDNSLDWIIQDLQVSSALASAQGFGSEKSIQIVLNGYAEVGAALEANTPIQHSERVRAAAKKIISIADHRVPSVRFETAARDAIVPTAAKQKPIPGIVTAEAGRLARANEVYRVAPAYGAIRGRIQTLTNRGGLRFTLFDLLHDKAVSCYFSEGKQELIRGLWGKLAIVEGIVSRDPVNGRPLSVRQVDNVTSLNELEKRFEYQEAMGAAPSLSGLSPEEAIRRHTCPN